MWRSKGVKPANLAIFFRGMGTVMNSGLPQTRGLDIFIQTFKESDPVFSKGLEYVLRALRNGSSFSISLKAASNIFSDHHIRSVKAGENGNLSQTFVELADQEESGMNLKSQLRAALTYPAFILLFSILLTFFILPRIVIPAITQLSTNSNELHWLTKIVLNSCLILQHPLSLVCLVVVCLLLQRAYALHSIRLPLLRFVQTLPIIGPGLQAAYTAAFFRNFYQLYKVRIPLDRCFQFSGEASGSIILTEKFKRVTLQDIETLPKLFQTDFPPLVPHMISIGDETGKVEEMLVFLIRWYQEQLANALDKTISLLEPLFMLGMGLLTCVIVLAIMLPLMQVLNTL